MNLKLISHSDPVRKQAFLDFTPRALYGASFVEWDARGCWNEKYRAYSLFEPSGRIVSNVSISTMQLLVDGKVRRGVQFSAVGTLPEHRGQGHSRRLMEKVLEDYAGTTDLFFLFANESVLDFYLKFGFRRVKEHLFRAAFPRSAGGREPSVRTLHMAADEDLNLLRRLASERTPVTRRFGALDYEHILYFYAILAYGDSILYWPERELALVAETEGRLVRVYDIIARDGVALQEVLPAMLGSDFDEIVFYFTPELFDLAYDQAEVYEDSPLFVRGDFPLQDATGPHDHGPGFKFPALGQT